MNQHVLRLASAFAAVFLACLVAAGNGHSQQPGADRRPGRNTGKPALLSVVFTVSPSSISEGYTVDLYQRLAELGWTRGNNLVVEERWAEGSLERMQALMEQAVAHHPDVILTSTETGALAARRATRTIPIVANSLGDPVASGLAASLSRPGGNVTGISLQSASEIPSKWLQLLREIVPRLSTVAVIRNTDSPLSQMQSQQVVKSAKEQGIALRFLDVRSEKDLRPAFDAGKAHAQAAMVLSNPVTYQHRHEVSQLAANHRLPVMYAGVEYVPDGGMMGYAPDLRVMYRRIADYIDKVLRGGDPAEIPIEQATDFRLVVALKTAKALRITIPDSILLRADEVLR